MKTPESNQESEFYSQKRSFLLYRFKQELANLKIRLKIWENAKANNVVPCANSDYVLEIEKMWSDIHYLIKSEEQHFQVKLSEQDLIEIKHEYDKIKICNETYYCSECTKKLEDWHESLVDTGKYAGPITRWDGFVYFLKNGFNWKIGYTLSNNPLKRIKDHTKYFPELKLEHLIWCQTPFEVEKWFHDFFDKRNQRTHGKYELFTFDDQSLIYCIKSFCESELFKKLSKRNKIYMGDIHLGSKKIICDLY